MTQYFIGNHLIFLQVLPSGESQHLTRTKIDKFLGGVSIPLYHINILALLMSKGRVCAYNTSNISSVGLIVVDDVRATHGVSMVSRVTG